MKVLAESLQLPGGGNVIPLELGSASEDQYKDYAGDPVCGIFNSAYPLSLC